MNFTKAVDFLKSMLSNGPKFENIRCRSSWETPSRMFDTLKVLGGIGPLKPMVVETERERMVVVFVRESVGAGGGGGGGGVRKRETTVVFDRWC